MRMDHPSVAAEFGHSEDTRALQWARVRTLMAKVWQRNDFYRDHWRNAGVVDPERIGSLADFTGASAGITALRVGQHGAARVPDVRSHRVCG